MLTKIKSTSRKALSIVLVFVMSFTALVLCNPIEADAIDKDGYVEGRYYYYPAGTQFISSIQFGVDESRADAVSAATANGYTMLTNAKDGGDYNMNYKSNSGTKSYPYIFLGYKTTTNINEALGTALRATIYDDDTSEDSRDFTVQLSIGGTRTIPFKKAHNTDLNKGMGGDTPYIYLYYHDPAEYSATYPSLGLPIVSLTGWANAPGTSAGHSVDNIHYVPMNDTTDMADFDEGVSDAGWVYLFYDNVTVYEEITASVNTLIDILEQTKAVKDKSFYTAASWAAYEAALAEANRIWGRYNNKYKAGDASKEEIATAVSNLGRAMDSLQTSIKLDAVSNGGTVTTTEYVINCGLKDTVDFPAGLYTATKEGHNFLGWNLDKNATSGIKHNMSVPLNSTVYAIFAVTQHSVYFQNPVTLQTVSTQEVSHGGSAVAPVVDQYLKKDLDAHYVFNGWDKDFTNVTTSLTVTANYVTAEHKYSRIQYVAATCVKDGSEVHKCSDCGQEKTVVLPKNAESHNNITEFPAKASTCKEYGYTAYTYCNDCRTVVSGRELLPLAGCSWSDWTVTDPTCEKEGVKTRRCTVCNKTESESIPALGHTWGEWSVVKDASCDAAGRRQRSCPVCSTTEVEMIPALGHDYKATVTDPTCTEKGFTTYTCSRDCGSFYIDEYVDALGHKWEDVGPAEIEATCTSSGRQYQECAVCGSSRTTTVPKLGHDWTNKEIIKEATCDTDGVMNASCGRCGEEETNITIDALGHDWDEGVTGKPATCTEDGYDILSCKRENCGKTMEIPVLATGHVWDEGVVSTPATCAYEGEKIVTCTVCSATDTVEIPKLNHKYSGIVTAPTCVDQGYTEYKCSECGDEIVEDFVPAKGHSFSITIVPPTCIKEGYTFARCSNCEHSQKTNFVDALGHNYTTTTVDPTCTEKGYDYHVCTRGDSTYKDNYVDKLGHDYVKSVVAPTCTEKGYDLYSCSRCDTNYKENYVNATGHSYVEIERVEPVGTQSGYVLYSCTACNHQYKETIFRGDRALVCITLYDQHGNPVKEATIYVTELVSGETFTLYTDLNGYFTEVLSEGDYELYITKLGYVDTIGYIYVADGDAQIDIPTVTAKECDCNCHKNDVWAKIWRIFMKIRKFFGMSTECCDDSEI